MVTGRRKASRTKKEETTWQERVIQIRRVSKVVKGGKKLSFRAIVVVGNERGQVGVGVGKASDVIGAVKKGVADGKKHLIDIPITKSNSIPHPSDGVGGGVEHRQAAQVGEVGRATVGANGYRPRVAAAVNGGDHCAGGGIDHRYRATPSVTDVGA
jgi:ribosomal protein S5